MAVANSGPYSDYAAWPDADPKELPLEITLRRTSHRTLLVVAFVGVILSVFTLSGEIPLSEDPASQRLAAYFLLLISALLAALFFALGRGGVQITLDTDQVHVAPKFLIGGGSGWREPLDGYSAIVWRKEKGSSGSPTSSGGERKSFVWHRIELVHPDPTKTLPLFQQTVYDAQLRPPDVVRLDQAGEPPKVPPALDPKRPERMWRSLAELTGLPAEDRGMS